VGVYRTVWNDYTVTVRWLVKTVHCSLPMCCSSWPACCSKSAILIEREENVQHFFTKDRTDPQNRAPAVLSLSTHPLIKNWIAMNKGDLCNEDYTIDMFILDLCKNFGQLDKNNRGQLRYIQQATETDRLSVVLLSHESLFLNLDCLRFFTRSHDHSRPSQMQASASTSQRTYWSELPRGSWH